MKTDAGNTYLLFNLFNVAKQRYALLIAVVLGITSCAIPVLPTGGPQDETPPVIIDAVPEAESVNVSTDRVRIVFSEFVDQASFAQAISVTPTFDRPLQYKWRKNRVDITFPEPLRENTTYILTIDTRLRDVNRVALTQPITFAFATGPVINRGKIAGRVIEPLEGNGVPSFDVFAYALADSTLPDSLPDSPAYRIQTDDQGGFAFDYMSEQPYFVVALRDLNRNRMPDGIEPFAVPPVPVIYADTTSPDGSLTWFVTKTDTIPPRIQRVRALSNQRFMLRLSESIRLTSRDPALWTLKDSVSNQTFPVEDVYLYPEDPRQIYIKTAELFASTHLLQAGGLTDSTGNPVDTTAITFRPSANSDTLQLRFLGFQPENLTPNNIGARILLPDTDAGIRFNQAVTRQILSDIVTIEDSTQAPLAFQSSSTDGSIYDLTVTNLPAGMPFTIEVAGTGVGAPDTTYTMLFQQLTEENLGELRGQLVAEDTTGQSVVELYPTSNPDARERIGFQIPDSSGSFVFSRLPDKSQYRFRAFQDYNANLRWDGGQLLPYQIPEPLTWYSDSLQVRARWEQTLSDTLKIER